MFGGLKISGMRRGEWIVHDSDVLMEPIPDSRATYAGKYGIGGDEPRRPYYLRRLALFGRELYVWIPDYAMRSTEEMNQWAIDKLLSSHVSNAMNTYGTRLPEEREAS